MIARPTLVVPCGYTLYTDIVPCSLRQQCDMLSRREDDDDICGPVLELCDAELTGSEYPETLAILAYRP